jgi:hypothetical protein
MPALKVRGEGKPIRLYNQELRFTSENLTQPEEAIKVNQ